MVFSTMKTIMKSVSQAPRTVLLMPSWDDVASLIGRIDRNGEVEPSVECLLHDYEHNADYRLDIIRIHICDGMAGLGWFVERTCPKSGNKYFLQSTDLAKRADDSYAAASVLGCPEVIAKRCILSDEEVISRTRNICCGITKPSQEIWVPLNQAMVVK